MKTFLFLFLSSLAFAETIISPNMNLPVPIVSQTTGPEWANDINACMSAIDSHDHTPGKGVPISSSSLNITSDLPLNNNSLISAKAVTYSSQASFANSRSLYVITPDLYYNDGNGNVIRITQSGSVAGASGTITGLPSGTASASYQSVGGTFQFQSATATPANIDGASFIVRQQSVSPNGITIKSPNSLGASYNFTLPTSVPSFLSLLTMSTSGVLSTVGYHTPTVQRFTSGSGTYTTPTSPGPTYIKITMVGAGGGGAGSGTAAGGTGGTGGDTTFGTSVLTAAGGTGANWNTGVSGVGGAATVAGVGVSLIAVSGGSGSGNSSFGSVGASFTVLGGAGAPSALGGGGGGGSGSAGAGRDAATNTGAGGGGGALGNFNGNFSGSGGGSGAYIQALILSPAATFSYGVGAAGAGGSAGTNGSVGGAGGSGFIVVEELYQ